MQLSTKAIADLRIALKNSYGEALEESFTDEEVEEIGLLLLTIGAEGMKMRAREALSQSEKQ